MSGSSGEMSSMSEEMSTRHQKANLHRNFAFVHIPSISTLSNNSISKQYLITLPASFAGYLELVNNLKAIEWDLNHNLEGDIQYVANKLTEFYPSQSPSVLITSPRCQNIFRCHTGSMRIGH